MLQHIIPLLDWLKASPQKTDTPTGSRWTRLRSMKMTSKQLDTLGYRVLKQNASFVCASDSFFMIVEISPAEENKICPVEVEDIRPVE